MTMQNNYAYAQAITKKRREKEAVGYIFWTSGPYPLMDRSLYNKILAAVKHESGDTSLKSIAVCLGLSEGTVKKWQRAMVDKGYFIIVQRRTFTAIKCLVNGSLKKMGL